MIHVIVEGLNDRPAVGVCGMARSALQPYKCIIVRFISIKSYCILEFAAD